LATEEDVPMKPYVSELVASHECEGAARKVVCIGDSGQKGTDVYWCEPIGRWVCVDLEEPSRLVTCEEVALIRLQADANPEDGVSQRALASDFEREDGLWLIDTEEMDRLAGRYGAALEVLWSSSTKAAAHRVA
jgi:hypothetical protein